MRVSGTAPLGLSDRPRLAGEIVLAYLRTRRELRRAPLDDVLSRLRDSRRATCAPSPESPRATLEQAMRLGRAVVRMLSLLPGDTRCLMRSLVLTHLLARRGISATLVIGTRSQPEFLAHAWVECAGAPILSPGDGTFARLVEL